MFDGAPEEESVPIFHNLPWLCFRLSGAGTALHFRPWSVDGPSLPALERGRPSASGPGAGTALHFRQVVRLYVVQRLRPLPAGPPRLCPCCVEAEHSCTFG